MVLKMPGQGIAVPMRTWRRLWRQHATASSAGALPNANPVGRTAGVHRRLLPRRRRPGYLHLGGAGQPPLVRRARSAAAIDPPPHRAQPWSLSVSFARIGTGLRLTRQHEDWDLDEIMAGVPALAVVAAWFAVRRRRDAACAPATCCSTTCACCTARDAPQRSAGRRQAAPRGLLHLPHRARHGAECRARASPCRGTATAPAPTITRSSPPSRRCCDRRAQPGRPDPRRRERAATMPYAAAEARSTTPSTPFEWEHGPTTYITAKQKVLRACRERDHALRRRRSPSTTGRPRPTTRDWPRRARHLPLPRRRIPGRLARRQTG